MAENNLIENGRLIYAKSHIIAGRSGVLPSGLAADAIVGAIRNIGTEELIVDAVDMAFWSITDATAPGGAQFAFYKVSGLTVLPATGQRATPPVPVRKRTADFTLLDPALDASCSISGVVALTGGTPATPTAVDDPLGVLICTQQSSVLTTAYAVQGSKRWDPKNWIPITLQTNEGIYFTNMQTLPTALTGKFAYAVDVRRA